MIKSNTFAEACYNQNTIEELEKALRIGPDKIDMATWDINEQQWREDILTAIAEKRKDGIV